MPQTMENSLSHFWKIKCLFLWKSTCRLHISEIVKIEAPLSEEWLLKRTVTMFGKTKVTNVVKQEFDRLMLRSEKFGIKRKRGFLYTPDNKYVLRVPAPGSEKREIKYISLEELAVGMWVIIQQNVTVDKEGLFTTITRELGFQRMGEAIIERMNAALAELNSLIVVDGNNISLRT